MKWNIHNHFLQFVEYVGIGVIIYLKNWYMKV